MVSAVLTDTIRRNVIVKPDQQKGINPQTCPFKLPFICSWWLLFYSINFMYVSMDCVAYNLIERGQMLESFIDYIYNSKC